MSKDPLRRTRIKVEIIDEPFGVVRTIQGLAENFDLEVNGDSGLIKLSCQWGPGFDAIYSEMLVLPADR